MTVALWIAVAILAAGLLVLLGAQVEQFDQLKQLRRLFDLEDRITPVTVNPGVVGTVASEAGLPAELDAADRSLVLFLSDKCATCQTIARSLQGDELPPDTWLVVVPVVGDGASFTSKYELTGPRILIDADHTITEGLGLDTTPSALVLDGGRITDAHTIPSVRKFHESLPSRRAKLLPVVPGDNLSPVEESTPVR